MKKNTKPTPAEISRVLNDILSKPNRRGAGTSIPGATVVDHYPNGQPKTYMVDGKKISRHVYRQLVSALTK
jgi:hypothetical protein